MYGLKSKNPSKYEIIKKQMDDVFKKYVKKLTSKFESIAKQIKN